jgi:hypothetical protein
MRFSIRDILWLTAVVALAATVYTERLHMQRQRARFAEEKARREVDFASKLDAERVRLESLRQQNISFRNQLSESYQREQKLEPAAAKWREYERQLRQRGPRPPASALDTEEN